MTVSYPISSPAHGETVDDTDLAAFADASNDLNTRLLVLEGAEHGLTTGTIASGANSATKAVTLTGTYTTAPLVFCQHDSTVVGSAVGNFGVRVTARSTTGFTVTVYRTDGTNAPSPNVVGFIWHAIRI